ncbi:MAG: thiamine pyrophosphate-binding protein [Acidobacteria bacterium]|nr:MAG: thiamine pyrophosphate-binding protein [Acidobacteriota bacterium]PIE90941.1 MAG: thiamine pyrophosphate-binding protein [Acidobacteriota bacterium]
MSTFYSKFERHAHGEGLKGKSTHYCPGCGHGLAHRFLAEAIDELEIQDRTIAISPVGCSVFLYYYFDVGNTQAAHGRAPAVALGHKVANPESIVVSYQGDGDLASIGMAEIMQAGQLGIPITVVFINNAIYGMTGGQLAPTTLMGQKTSTTPEGRYPLMGEPIQMAEIIAQLPGSVYVERTALFDAKNRNKTKRAIKKGLKLQKEKKGFAFIEVLAECPTHLKMSPLDTEQWVKENMVPIFPLGVKKDVKVPSTFEMAKPSFKAEKLLTEIDSSAEKIPRFSKKFPEHLDHRDVSLKLAGAGGDGAQTAAMLITHAGINEGYDATHIPSYGPESRGGTSYADVHVAKDEVLSPASGRPHILIAFNQPSLMKFAPTVRNNGIILYDSSIVKEEPEVDESIRMIGVPFSEIAVKVGMLMVKNTVALGALQGASEIFPSETFLTTIKDALKHKQKYLPMNEEAFNLGRDYVKNM